MDGYEQNRENQSQGYDMQEIRNVSAETAAGNEQQTAAWNGQQVTDGNNWQSTTDDKVQQAAGSQAAEEIKGEVYNSYGTAGYGYQNPQYQYSPYYGNPGYIPVPPQPVKAKKHINGGLAKLMRLVACALIFGLVAGGSFIGVEKLYELVNPETQVIADSGSNGSKMTGNDTIKATAVLVSTGNTEKSSLICDLVEEALPSTVSINGTFITSSWLGQYESSGSGSGIIVGKNDTELLIVTNNHVVQGAKTLTVKLIDDTEVSASLKGANASADLAVVAVRLSDLSKDTLAAIKIATLGNSDEVRVGEMVLAIGNALGYGQSLTVGYISAKDREVTVDNNTMSLLQTDAAINPGNSGGALLNLEGEVIGINSVKYASEKVEGMGFAIPVSNVKEIIEGLMNRLSAEDKGYLGVYIDNVTEEDTLYFNLPSGVYVKDFTENSAAKEAGLQMGDIITAINGTTVTDADALIDKVTSYRYGTTITVTLQRIVNKSYQEMNIDVELRQSASYTTQEAEPTPTAEPDNGIQKPRK